MAIAAQILSAKVAHARLFPKKNRFAYGIYYLDLPLDKLDELPANLAHNKPALLSFYDRDHGPKDGTSLKAWIGAILAEYKIDKADGPIRLIAMPRVFGYVFNPVSFWLCHDKAGGLRAVLCEVNNTFGQRHNYLCYHKDRRVIKAGDKMTANKLFHVSPFLAREGHYEFNFDIAPTRLAITIDFYDAAGKKQLITSLAGQFIPLDKASLRRHFWAHPLVTLKAIGLIHWQALILLLKGIKYIAKPKQIDPAISTSSDDKSK